MTRGRFITIEGGEGAGKSTQLRLLAERLRARGIDCLVTREPGGTEGAEAIRELIVHGPPERWRPLAELYLFLAAREDHLHRAILPALDRGQWVLCDRFADSTRVYQGCAGGLGLDLVDALQAPLLGPHRARPDAGARPAGRGRHGALCRARRHGPLRGQGHRTITSASAPASACSREREPERFAVVDASAPETVVARAGGARPSRLRLGLP